MDIGLIFSLIMLLLAISFIIGIVLLVEADKKKETSGENIGELTKEGKDMQIAGWFLIVFAVASFFLNIFLT